MLRSYGVDWFGDFPFVTLGSFSIFFICSLLWEAILSGQHGIPCYLTLGG